MAQRYRQGSGTPAALAEKVAMLLGQGGVIVVDA